MTSLKMLEGNSRSAYWDHLSLFEKEFICASLCVFCRMHIDSIIFNLPIFNLALENRFNYIWLYQKCSSFRLEKCLPVTLHNQIININCENKAIPTCLETCTTFHLTGSTEMILIQLDWDMDVHSQVLHQLASLATKWLWQLEEQTGTTVKCKCSRAK